MIRQRLLHILQTLFLNALIDREELMVFRGEYVWHLHIDILVLDELALHQLDMIGWAIRSAIQNLELP